MTFLYYLNLDLVKVFKHISAHFCGITLLYDLVSSLPFQNKTISKFYGVYAISFEVIIWTKLFIFEYILFVLTPINS